MAPLRNICLAAVLLSFAASASAIAAGFYHGVASGDPLPDRVIIWTRVTPLQNQSSIDVTWHVSTDRKFPEGSKTLTGVVNTNSSVDFTVKHDVAGLDSGKLYYYRFVVSDSAPQVSRNASPLGKFKVPLPVGSGKKNQNLLYAIFSCSNWGFGYFNAYNAASLLNLDFWVHLGDYIYEYGPEGYPSPSQATRYQPAPFGGLQPPHEIVSLDDYRLRHSLYRMDPGLQALSSAAALVAMWDDHEIANNARKASAENHQPATEGNYQDRVTASIKAYHEWMPTRDHFLATGDFVGINYNRTIQFGDLLSFIMTETRLTARTDEQLPGYGAQVSAIIGNTNPGEWNDTQKAAIASIKAASDALAADPNSHMLGQTQLDWMESEVKKSVAQGTTWQAFGFGTVMQDQYQADVATAIENKKKTDVKTAAIWEDAYKKTAFSSDSPVVSKSYGLACYNLPYFHAPLNVTDAIRASTRTSLALGQNLITSGFDAWAGFQAEKQKYLAIAAQGSNVVQYGGDSHADWVGVQSYNGKAIVGEFDVGSVTSTAYEANAMLPVDLLNEAMVAAANKTGLRKAYAGRKGFMLVTLTEDNHHVDYIHLNHCTVDYKATCDFAYEWGAGSKNIGDVTPAKCTKNLKLTNKYNVLISQRWGQHASIV